MSNWTDFRDEVLNSLHFETVTEEMKEAAARAIAGVIPEDELSADYVLPDPFNPLIVERIKEAIKEVSNSLLK